MSIANAWRDQWRPDHGTQVRDAKEGDGGDDGTAPWPMSRRQALHFDTAAVPERHCQDTDTYLAFLQDHPQIWKEF